MGESPIGIGRRQISKDEAIAVNGAMSNPGVQEGARSSEQGGLILSEEDLSPIFLDLPSGLAGELLQKFVTYRVPLALANQCLNELQSGKNSRAGSLLQQIQRPASHVVMAVFREPTSPIRKSVLLLYGPRI